MLLYEDIITGDELFSDAFPMYVFSPFPQQRAHCDPGRRSMASSTRLTARWLLSRPEPMSISVGPSYLLRVHINWRTFLGANPSAEDQEEGLEEGASQVNNVVHSFRLQSTSFDKKSFLTYLKVCINCFTSNPLLTRNFRDTWNLSRKSWQDLTPMLWQSLRKVLPHSQRSLLQTSRITNLWALSAIRILHLSYCHSTRANPWTQMAWLPYSTTVRMVSPVSFCGSCFINLASEYHIYSLLHFLETWNQGC